MPENLIARDRTRDPRRTGPDGLAENQDRNGENMGLKGFLLAIAGLAAIGAVAANSASAAAETGGKWYVEGTEITEPVGVVCDGSVALAGELSGVEIALKAERVECIELTIFNEEGAGKASGKLKFTGMTVATIPTCEIETGSVETYPLNIEVFMDSEDPELVFEKFDTAEEKVNLAIVRIRGESCPITGNRPLKGYVFGEAAAPTGVQSVFQSLAFSEEVDATTGGELEFSGNPAHLDGKLYTVIPGSQFGTE